ncbi:MAG TPA: enoyl-CoA hydratase [Sneathiellales bacterium]|jgi:enoyl-CoA hydratase/carnithine racemase|nr:enoyl-CoA hydratase [Sneathiellales bacterium]
MSYQDIRYGVENGVATVTLHRPDNLNAWTRQMERDVRAAMTEATQDDAVRVVVLTGAGRGFCAGADMNLLAGVQSGDDDQDARARNAKPGPIECGLDLPEDFSLRYTYFPTVPKTVIAAINGPCAGLGLVMALYTDVRFAAESAVFTSAFARRGLIAEHGISWMLPRLVGQAAALDLMLSARKVRAPEALQMGLVNQVYPDEELMETVYSYAEDLANNVSPRSMAVMKRQLYTTPFQNLEQAVEDGNREMALSFDSEDFKEGVAHFIEKRQAKFTGR